MLIKFGIIVPVICGLALGLIFYFVLPPPSVPTTNFIIGFMAGYIFSMGIGLMADSAYGARKARRS